MPRYQIIEKKDRHALREFLIQHGQMLLPFLELLEKTEDAVDRLVHQAGRSLLEALLWVSAEQVAGPRQPGKAKKDIRWHGSQAGVVSMAEQRIQLRRPRLRRKDAGRGAEVEIPAYEKMQNDERLSRRIWEILMLGVSTRKYKEVLPEVAEAVGVGKSAVSQHFVESSGEVLQRLMERRFDELDLVIVYLDGVVFGDYHAVSAIGVDTEGYKHVLGLREGASEHLEVAKGLLQDLIERGLDPRRRRLFIIDGSKALRRAIRELFGSEQLVQRCRKHKERNLEGHLPERLGEQVTATMRAAWNLPAEKGKAKIEQQAKWLEKEYPSAAESLREGLDEMFTINELGLPGGLRRCLGSTNVIESSFSGTKGKTRRVTHWQDGEMVRRWAASALVATEKKFRRIMGYQTLWTLKAHLDGSQSEAILTAKGDVG